MRYRFSVEQTMTVRKSIILYSVAMAVLLGILKFAEYRFFVRDLSLELYLCFTGSMGRTTPDACKGNFTALRI